MDRDCSCPSDMGLGERGKRFLVDRKQRKTVGEAFVENPRMTCRDIDVFYGENQAIKNVSLDIAGNEVIAMIGPSGCGKSTFIRCLNRMNDTIDGCRVTGSILLDDEDINQPGVDVVLLRAKVGMVFQKPNPFPQTVFDNVAYGPRVLGLTQSRSELEAVVERSLKEAVLWDEVGERLDQDALGLSLGEQQRLCIARVIAVEPEVILMDEPTSALDPIATLEIENLMTRLVKHYTIVVVTHNMQQAARVSEKTGLFWLGELVEFDYTSVIFTRPKEERTEAYITGRVG